MLHGGILYCRCFNPAGKAAILYWGSSIDIWHRHHHWTNLRRCVHRACNMAMVFLDQPPDRRCYNCCIGLLFQTTSARHDELRVRSGPTGKHGLAGRFSLRPSHDHDIFGSPMGRHRARLEECYHHWSLRWRRRRWIHLRSLANATG